MLKINNLKKSFGNNEVLKDINLNINKGEVVSILGPSGTGKSTLLRCINYLEEANSGTIEIKNSKFDFSNMKKDKIKSLRSHSSMVFQSYNLFKNMTALGNVMEPMVTVKKMDKKEAINKAEEYLDKVGLLDKKNFYPSELSGGQQQRVGIARAIAVNPDVLLFDEPTSALDPYLVDEVLTVIKELANEKRTMLIVTHEIQFAKNVSDKIIFMNNGYIVEEGTPEQVIENSKNPETRKFLKLDK